MVSYSFLCSLLFLLNVSVLNLTTFIDPVRSGAFPTPIRSDPVITHTHPHVDGQAMPGVFRLQREISATTDAAIGFLILTDDHAATATCTCCMFYGATECDTWHVEVGFDGR